MSGNCCCCCCTFISSPNDEQNFEIVFPEKHDFRCISELCVLCMSHDKLHTSSPFPFGLSLFRGRHSDSLFHFNLFSASSTLTPTTCVSFFTASVNLLFGLLPGGSTSSILLPMCPLSLLCTRPNHSYYSGNLSHRFFKIMPCGWRCPIYGRLPRQIRPGLPFFEKSLPPEEAEPWDIMAALSERTNNS